MRIEQKVTVDASRRLVWEYVTEPANYPVFMEGLTRWEIAGEVHTGLGARYRMLLRVGAADVGGLIEVVEWQPEGDMAWSSVTGIDQRGRWRLRERSPNRTYVELRLSYGVAGAGLFGWLSERVAAPTVRRHLQRAVQQLKRQVEQEQTRRRAAARKAARAGAA
jgi:uncharacterized membrane protein